MIRWIIFIAIFGVIDLYAFQAFRTVAKASWLQWLYWVISLAVIANFVYQITTIQAGQGFNQSSALAFGLFISFFVPKLLMVFFMFGEDIIRVPQAIHRYFVQGQSAETGYFVSRRKFVSQIALGLAAIPFCVITLWNVQREVQF